MNLEYTDKGKFVPETQALIQDLKAEAVLIMVLGSETRGSGACCELRTMHPEHVGWAIVDQLRSLADSLAGDLERGALEKAEVIEHDTNGHKQEVNQYRARSIRPGELEP